jgi:hypothetical protein
MYALQRHEWEYGVSLAPLILLLLWAGKSLVRRIHLRPVAPWAALLLLLLVPVALNTYEPGWNRLLKATPFIGNSSNLLRWFALYIMPAAVGSGLALDAITRQRRGMVAAFAMLSIIVVNALTDRGFYGEGAQASYRVARIQASWRNAHSTQTGPRITAVRVLTDGQGHVLMTPNRQDAFTYGYSQLYCEEPLFGYGLERFPMGALRTGPALASVAGTLNIKDPACYLFPTENSCAPGGQFSDTQAAEAQAFLGYTPFPFALPLWASFAVWLSWYSALALAAVAVVLVAHQTLALRHRGLAPAPASARP